MKYCIMRMNEYEVIMIKNVHEAKIAFSFAKSETPDTGQRVDARVTKFQFRHFADHHNIQVEW